MKIDDKYYIPELEEFHVGFECEYFMSEMYNIDGKPIAEGFYRIKHDIIHMGKIETLKMLIERQQVRVKYLDESDIQSEGWKELADGFYFEANSDMDLFLKRREGKWIIQNEMLNSLFLGEIKNVNELRFIQERLGIK